MTQLVIFVVVVVGALFYFSSRLACAVSLWALEAAIALAAWIRSRRELR